MCTVAVQSSKEERVRITQAFGGEMDEMKLTRYLTPEAKEIYDAAVGFPSAMVRKWFVKDFLYELL